jgi:membrane associated rhomboid family serine protease
MKRLFQNMFGSLPPSARVLVLLYALGFPVAWAGEALNAFDLVGWLAFSPSILRQGEVWTAATYAFLSASALDWIVNLFWFATLVSVLARDWSGRKLWIYCLCTSVVAALLLTAMAPRMERPVAGNAAMIFGLLLAWCRLYGRERLILLGLGEISVIQAAVIIVIIELLVLFFGVGWRITLAMAGGGVCGWLYLVVAGKRELSKPSQAIASERIARLEL